LGAMKPEPGGEYIYLRDGYGPLIGFLYAWTTFLISKPGSIATIASGMVRILGTLSWLSFLPKTAFGPITWAQLLAVVLVFFITGINYIGVRRAGEFQLAFTILKIAIVFGVIFIAVFSGKGLIANFATEFSGARGGMVGFMAALLAALWAYDGWNNLNMVAGEIRDPGRNVPIALVAGMGIVGALYMLLNAAVQYVMAATAISLSPSPAADAVGVALGAGAATAFTAAMGFQMFATLNGAILTGARVPFAAAQDGYLIPVLARVHPVYKTPSASLVFQAVLASVLVLGIGTFKALFAITLFAEWLFYMLTTSTVFIFRRTQPDAPRPYRVWGYPVVPVLFIAASLAVLTYTFLGNLRNSAIGSLVILAGVPVFFGLAKWNKRA